MKKIFNGISYFEIIIVIVLLVTISSIAIPKFGVTTEKVRLKSDIQSAIIITNAVDLYEMEKGIKFENGSTNITKFLQENGYLRTSYKTQIGQDWVLDENIVKVKIDGKIDEEILSSLSEQELFYVKK